MSASRTDRGFTIPEVLVAAALLGLLTTLFVWFLVPALRMSAQGAARADLQQMAVLGTNRIAADLQDTAVGGVSILPRAVTDPTNDPVVLAMVPIEDVDTEGRRLWRDELVVYLWDRAQQRLYRKTWPPAPPASLSVDPLPTNRPSSFTAADLLSLAATPNGTERSVATGVVHFDVLHAGGAGPLTQPLTVEIGIEQDIPGQETDERFDFVKTVTLRN